MSTYSQHQRIRIRFRALSRLTVAQVRQMYALYQQHVDNATFETFLRDLSKKSGAILASRQRDGRVMGFSTLAAVHLKVDGQQVRGLFSGDAIVDPSYRAGQELVEAVHTHLLIERLKHPLTPFYWFVAAKGYGAYQQVTSRFGGHYPDVEGGGEHYRRIAEVYCQQFFPHAFDRARMLLDFGEDCVRLKANATNGTHGPSDARDRAFFERVNPTWRLGTEVLCLGAFDYSKVMRSLIDVTLNWARRHRPGTPASTTGLDVNERIDQLIPASSAHRRRLGVGQAWKRTKASRA